MPASHTTSGHIDHQWLVPGQAGTATNTLTAEQRQQFHSAGLVAVDGLLPPPLLAAAVAASAALHNGGIDHTAPGTAEFPFSDAFDALNQLTLCPALSTAAAELLGCRSGELRLAQCNSWCKVGGRAGGVQDQRMHCDYPNNSLLSPMSRAQRLDAVVAHIYFDTVADVDGPTAFVLRDGDDDPAYDAAAGAYLHMPGVGGHPSISDRAEAERYFEDKAPAAAAFRARLYAREKWLRFQPGTCVLYTLGTWHRGTPVRDGARRRVHTVVLRRAQAEWVQCRAPGAWPGAFTPQRSAQLDRLLGLAVAGDQGYSRWQMAVLGFPVADDASVWSDEVIAGTAGRYASVAGTRVVAAAGSPGTIRAAQQAPLFNMPGHGDPGEPVLGPAALRELADEGEVVLPGLLTEAACARLIESLERVAALELDFVEPGPEWPDTKIKEAPGGFLAEHDDYMCAVAGHPQLLAVARAALGSDDIRFDHCVQLTKEAGAEPVPWHTHPHADGGACASSGNDDQGVAFTKLAAADPSKAVSRAGPEKFIRVFFYVSGFDAYDGSLLTAPGSHHYGEAFPVGLDDSAFARRWLPGRVHKVTNRPLRVKVHAVPPGTVVVQLSHAAHAVSPRLPQSGKRYALVTSYMNPGAASGSRRVTQPFVERETPGLDGLKTLDLTWPPEEAIPAATAAVGGPASIRAFPLSQAGAGDAGPAPGRGPPPGPLLPIAYAHSGAELRLLLGNWAAVGRAAGQLFVLFRGRALSAWSGATRGVVEVQPRATQSF
jgi:ectoine hydroxylase-related dioxygenase (phytanoyl-CoA dioxygenase family)